MHQVLHIDEIMVRILTELRRSSDVAAMARVCRAFNELASDVLWQEITSILPLIMCMPSDLVRVTTSGRILVSFTRDIMPGDWRRFHRYAARVRYFKRRTTPSRLILDETVAFAFGLDCQPCLNLFPRLKSLEVPSDMEETEFQFLRLMIGPQLKSFKIYPLDALGRNTVSDGLIASLLEPLEDCHSLGHLMITHHSNQQLTAFNDIVTRTPFLHSFQLPYFQISLEGLTSLAGHTLLKRVSFTLEEDVLLAFKKQLSPDLCPFPALEYVHIVTPDLNTCTSFIRTFNTYRLKRFRLRLATIPTLAAMESHVSTLHNFCSHTALEKLEISSNANVWGITSRDLTIDSGILRPLFVLRGLLDVIIELPTHFVLDNAFISDVASSWPLLRTLAFRGPWPKPHKITLEGLLPLAQKCPRLTHLDLAVDGTVPPPWTQTRPGNGVSNFALLHLGVNESEVHNEEEVAAYLSDIFPRVKISSNGIWSGFWERVTLLVPFFAHIRQQERNSAQ